MTDLRGAGSRVLLVGTGCSTGGVGAVGLSSVHSVRRTLLDLQSVLVLRCGLAADHVRVLLDPALPFEVGEAIAQETEQAEGVLLIYYAGHGLVSLDGQLYLATGATDTRPGYLTHTAVAYAQVRNAVLDSPARIKVVMLDCCYSGRAFDILGGSVGADAIVLCRVHGGYVLTATGANEAAFAPPGESHTVFGGELIRLLTEGDPDGPPLLTLQHTYHYLQAALQARGFPRPRRLTTEGADELVLAVNPAYRIQADLGPDRDAPAGEWPEDGHCPYRGLAAFEAEDARWFFGRTDVLEVLTGRLAQHRPEAGPLVVVGPSGVGKSSLLRAGLLARLADGSFPVSDVAGWRRVVLTPGAHPLAALTTALTPLRVNDRPAEGRLVVIIDQIEEIFTECDDEKEREAFIDVLASGPDRAGSLADALVVIGLRADFYRHCLAYPALLSALQGNQLVLGPMSAADLSTAVQAPAATAGLALQAGLVQILLQDIEALVDAARADEDDGSSQEVLDGRQAPVLPLLSHALRETWRRRRGRMLTVSGYAETGRVARAVETSAETLYQGLDDDGQAVLQAMLLQMIAVREGMSASRRSVERDTLLEEIDAAESGPGERVLAGLVDAGLVIDTGEVVTIAHSALLQAWPRLRGWVAESRQGSLTRWKLGQIARRWQRQHRPSDLLYRGDQLTVAVQLANQGATPLPPVVREFLDSSTQQRDRRQRRNRRLLVVACVVALVAGGLGAYGINQLLSVCPPGLQQSATGTKGHECIGVTDGGYVFNSALAAVETRIAQENQWVMARGHAVTVALLEPFPHADTHADTDSDSGAMTLDQVRADLEGAYTAQWWANHTAGVGDTHPRIRLVLANEGSHEEGWQVATQQLDGMVNDTAPLVAVAGLGVSIAQTVSGAQDLSAHGLPMVGAVVTADQIDYSHLPGLVRVSPSNEQFVISLRNYLLERPDLDSALMVYDSHADDGTDLYVQSLRDDLAKIIKPGRKVYDPATFPGISARPDSGARKFGNITATVCAVRPGLVLFAGRKDDLLSFLRSLEDRACPDQSVTVATIGSELGDLNNPQKTEELKNRKIRLIYASSTDAAGWLAHPFDAPWHFKDFADAFRQQGFALADLADGDAIATHDAVLTSVAAIRLASATMAGSGSDLPSRQDVRNQLLNLNNIYSVPAAAGDLSFSVSDTHTGEPRHKPIPVLTIPSDGSSRNTDRYPYLYMTP